VGRQGERRRWLRRGAPYVAVLLADGLVAWGATKFWRHAPVVVVSATAALVLFEAAWIHRWRRRDRLWSFALLAALVLQVDWLPVLGSTFGRLGCQEQFKLVCGELHGERGDSQGKCRDGAPKQRETESKDSDQKRQEASNVTPQPPDTEFPSSRELLLKEYDTAKDEIHKRLDYEHVLFGLKFTLIGGILYTLIGFIRKDVDAAVVRQSDSNAAGVANAPARGQSFHALGRSPLAAAFFWASVVVCAIIDARIQFNAAFIATLGGWVGHLESVVLKREGLGWEDYLRKLGLMSNASYPFVRMSWGLVTWVLFAVTVFLFVVLSRPTAAERAQSATQEGSLSTDKLSGAFGVFAFGAFALSSIGFRPELNDVVLHSLIWGTLGSTALALALSITETGNPGQRPSGAPVIPEVGTSASAQAGRRIVDG